MTVEVYGDLDLKSVGQIKNALPASNENGLATLGQVLANRNQMDVKDACRVATTGNITLSGLQTVDGVSLAAGDRILVKDQTTASANGIYVVGTGAWSRATDADASTEVTQGLSVAVVSGTTKGTGTPLPIAVGYALTTADPITIGTTSLSFALLGGTASAYGAGNGIDITGTTVSVKPATGGGVQSDTNGVGLTAPYKNAPQGVWNNTIAYVPGDIVQRSVHMYKALASNTGFDPLTSPANWTRFYDGLLERVSDPLAQWKRATAENSATWLAIGGGFTEGEFVSSRASRYLDKVSDSLHSSFGVRYGGKNYLPPAFAVTPTWGITATTISGTITDSTAAVVPGMRAKQYATGAQAVYTVFGTSVDIWYGTGPTLGTFVYNTDDTVNISVNAYAATVGTARLRVSLGARNTHTVKIIATTGPIIFGGLTVFDQDESIGIRVYDGSRTNADMTSLPSNASYLAAVAPDLITIELGSEKLGTLTQAQYRDALITYVAGIRSVLPDKLPSIMIVLPETASFGAQGLLYKAGVREMVSLDKTIGLIDLTVLGYERRTGLPSSDGRTTKTNLATNPRCAVDVTGWSAAINGATSTSARVTGDLPYLGGTAFRVTLTAAPSNTNNSFIYANPTGTGGFPVTVGTTYTASAYVAANKNPTGNVGIYIQWYTAAGASLSATTPTLTAVTANVWARRSVTAVAPATAAFAQVVMQFSNMSNFISTDWISMTGVVFEASAAVSRYFEGTLLLGIRQNLAINPRGYNSTTGWSSVLGTSEAAPLTFPVATDTPTRQMGYVRRTVSTAKTAGASGTLYNEATDGGLTGDIRVISAWVRSSVAAQVALTGNWRSAGTTTASVTSSVVTLTVNVWQRISVVMTAAPSSYDSVQAYITMAAGYIMPAAATLDVTSVLIEDAVALDNYFDGDLGKDDGYQYAWTGTANASIATSTPRGYYPTDGAHAVIASSITSRLLALPASLGVGVYQQYRFVSESF